MNPIIFSPINKCEQAVAGYLYSELANSASIYTGLDNDDKLNPPCIIVQCKDATEVVFNTRNYKFTVDILVKEMAYDNTVDEQSTVAGNVAAYFGDSISSSAALNNYFSSSQAGINIYQVQITGYNQGIVGDAWVNNFTYNMVGALCPTV